VKICPILPIQYSLSLKAKYPPFNQHSILISPDSMSHSCVHNSFPATILRQMNPCHILLLHFSSDLFQYYSAVTKCFVWTDTHMSSSKNYEWAPQIWYIYHKCWAFLLPWIWIVIFSECKYYDALMYVIFSSFPLYLQIYCQIFSPTTPPSVTPSLSMSSFT
jgi:hypothetical protein